MIDSNFVSEALYTLNDGGAIAFDHADGLRFENNIVQRSVGDLNGVSTSADDLVPRTTGIYFGNHVIVNTICSRNTVTECNTGILIDHEPGYMGNRIMDNTVFNCSETQIAMQDLGDQDNHTYQGAYDDLVAGNVLYCLTSKQTALFQDQVEANSFDGTEPLVDFGDFRSNYYFNPFNEVVVHQRVRYTTTAGSDLGSVTVLPWTLSGWQANLEEDLDSYVSPLRQKDYEVIDYEDPLSALESHFDLTSSASEWHQCSNEVREVVVDGGSNALHLENCTYVERICGGCYITGSSIDEGTYSFQFRMRSEDADALQHAGLYNNNFKYQRRSYFGVGPDWPAVPYELIVDINDVVSSDNLLTGFQDLQFGMGAQENSSLWLDDVVVRKCTLNSAFPDEIAENHLLHYNDGTDVDANGDPNYEPLELPENTCWADVYNNVYSGTVSVAPFESVVLYRLDAFDPESATTVTGTETWSTNKNITGSVVVDEGATLIVDNCIIGFAESDGTTTTNLIVKQGGTLIVRNNAHLTSWVDCSAAPVMWDGVVAPMDPASSGGNPKVEVISGGQVSNALTALYFAEGDPAQPVSTATLGSYPRFTIRDAVFRNNLNDIVVLPAIQGSLGASLHRSAIDRTSFLTTGPLNDAVLKPGKHIYLRNIRNLPIRGCAFANTSGLDPTLPTKWGIGIHSVNSSPLVTADVDENRNTFNGLLYGVRAEQTMSSFVLRVDEADFSGCAGGIYMVGCRNARITRNTFLVPDLDFTTKGVSATYGTYMNGCTGFELEENYFTGGPGGLHPKVGSSFRTCGPFFNEFYNNRYDGFTDSNADRVSAGTIVMGVNADGNGVGLTVKCNDYSNDDINDYDAAFTGESVQIAAAQGDNIDVEAPAGNTFAIDPACSNNTEQHLYVQDEINYFTYYHHNPQSTTQQVMPECISTSMTADPLIQNTTQPYADKETACPTDPSLQMIPGDLQERAAQADSSLAVVEEVYADWSDGGSTEGLTDYIMDPDNDSYAVRNKLMLVAPSVSADAWRLTFFNRDPPLNPWHLAQALLANSPLEPVVLAMMDTLPVDPFYKELVLDGQNGGLSMHTIYQSEIAHFSGQKNRALHDLVALALLDSSEQHLNEALADVVNFKMADGRAEQLALYLARNDVDSARIVVDDALNLDPDDSYFQVQDLLVGLLEQELDLMELDGNGVALLESIATSNRPGSGNAHAWLILLGAEYTEEILLPDPNRSHQPEPERSTPTRMDLLAAYPNPSNGPVYLMYQVPEGVEQVEVRLTDALGRLVLLKKVMPKNGIIEVMPRDMASGVHVGELFFDGIRVATTKLQVVR